MAATTRCSKCAAEVPSENLVLHELRCPGLLQYNNVRTEDLQRHAAHLTLSAPPPTHSVPLPTPSAPPLPTVDFFPTSGSHSAPDVEMHEVHPSVGHGMSSWSCEQCTYENAAHLEQCEMCELPRYGDSETPVRRPDPVFHERLIGEHEGSEIPLPPPDPAVREWLRGGHFNREHQFDRRGPEFPEFLQGALGGALVGGALAGLHGGRSRALSGALTGAINGGLLAHTMGQARAMRDERTMPGREQHLTPGATLSSYPRQRIAMMTGPQGMHPISMEGMFQDIHQMELLQQMLLHSQSEDPQMRPAASGAVTTLPTHVVTDQEVASMPEEHRACMICLEDFRGGDEQRMLPCFHRFHRGCVDTWLAQSGACPICKHRVDSEREEPNVPTQSVRQAGA